MNLKLKAQMHVFLVYQIANNLQTGHMTKINQYTLKHL